MGMLKLRMLVHPDPGIEIGSSMPLDLHPDKPSVPYFEARTSAFPYNITFSIFQLIEIQENPHLRDPPIHLWIQPPRQ